MGNSWSYVPNDIYKPTNELIHLLLKIISRGGNFLLNIGPSSEGDWSDTAYARLKEIGSWMKVHGQAVYNTIPLAPYEVQRTPSENGDIVYLQSKDKKTIYVYVLSDKKDDVILPANILLHSITLNKASKITLLDALKEKIKWKATNDGTEIEVPSKLQNKVAGRYAVAFKITL
jgi:alpha-L-fucosidase